MDYAFRINAFHKPAALRLVEGELHVIDANQNIVQKIGLDRIRKIHQFAGIFATSDPTTGRFASQYCVLKIAGAKSIAFRNGYFLGPDRGSPWTESATNQTEEYGLFLKELKIALHRVAPNVRIVYGGIVAALAWGVNILLGLGLIGMGVGMFFTDKLSVAMTIGLLFLCFGGFLSWLSAVVCRSYWPRSFRLEQDLLGTTSL